MILKLFNGWEYRHHKTLYCVSRERQTLQITQNQPGMKGFRQRRVPQGSSASCAVGSGGSGASTGSLSQCWAWGCHQGVWPFRQRWHFKMRVHFNCFSSPWEAIPLRARFVPVAPVTLWRAAWALSLLAHTPGCATSAQWASWCYYWG